MSDIEFEKILKLDSYLVPRKIPDDFDKQLFLKEVDFVCPLCGKELRHSKQKKKNQLFEIAHIYPNRPTKQQYENLIGLERLGEDCESFENKIALCIECHKTQDFQTNIDDYLKLLEKKKYFLKISSLRESTINFYLENEIILVIEKISQLSDEDFTSLKYSPVSIVNKFSKSEFLLKNYVSNNIAFYYPLIRDTFKSMDGKDGFCLEILSGQIRNCYKKMSILCEDKIVIFEQLTNWFLHFSGSQSKQACEIVLSFFIQNCEVFDAITE